MHILVDAYIRIARWLVPACSVASILLIRAYTDPIQGLVDCIIGFASSVVIIYMGLASGRVVHKQLTEETRAFSYITKRECQSDVFTPRCAFKMLINLLDSMALIFSLLTLIAAALWRNSPRRVSFVPAATGYAIGFLIGGWLLDFWRHRRSGFKNEGSAIG